MSLLHYNFESFYLHCSTDITVILPDKPRVADPAEFYGNGEKYPVLWLLHGTYGDHTDWLRKTMIEIYAREKNLIVVMFSGMNANYSDWPDFGIGYNTWDYLTKELMPIVYNWLPASDKREDNFLAGLSMGGTGAIQYAVGFPDKFAATAVLSWAPYDFRTIEADGSPFGEHRQALITKNAGGADAYLKGVENVWDRLPEFNRLAVKPRLFFSMGDKDFLYEYYKKFRVYAQEIGLDATFEELPGYGHEWRFWDIAIQHALTFFGFSDVDLRGTF